MRDFLGMSLQRHLMAGAAIVAVAAASPAMAQTRQFNVPAQPASRGIPTFARQAGVQIIASGTVVGNRRTNAVRGNYSVPEGLRILLNGTGLTAEGGAGGIITIRAGQTPGEAEAGSAAADSESADARGVSEVLVVGSRSINADIARSEDDTQPYVVLSREEIQTSQAATVGEFLMRRLPQNGQQQTLGQASTGLGGANEINLRGLGSNQTLILVDGRRLPGLSRGQNLGQPQIEGIPLSLVERIEILPTTASGIYGGGATGGAINIITRRDYRGIDLTLSSGVTERGDAFNYRIEGSIGRSFNDGRTRILIAGSHAESDPLVTSDRDFARRSRALLFANNPSAFSALSNPPLGAATNIRSADGSILVLKNGMSLGSFFTSVPTGYSGTGSDGGLAFVQNAGRYNLDLPSNPGGAGRAILQDLEANSATVNIRQAVGSRLEFFLDGSWYENRAVSQYAFVPSTATLQPNAPNNPFTTAINVSFPGPSLDAPLVTQYSTLRGTVGAIGRLGGGWALSVDYSYSRARTTEARSDPPFADYSFVLATGSLDVIRDLTAYPLDFGPYRLPYPSGLLGPGTVILQDANARLSGPLFRLPGGRITLTAGAEWRDENVHTNRQTITIAPGFDFNFAYPARSQSIWSGFSEIRAPIVGPANGIPFLRELELQASVRHDRYSSRTPDPFMVFLVNRDDDFPAPNQVSSTVSATKFTLGARLSPVEGITFRASYGTGFLPPSLDQLVTIFTGPTTATLSDPRRGGTLINVPFIVTQGGNRDLRPEESRSWSVGMILAPSALPNLRFSVDYTNISKSDEILGQLAFQDALNFEDVFAGRVTRNPLTDADRALGYTGGTIAAIDARAINALRSRVEAWDFQLDYSRETSVGTFALFAIATYQPTLQRRLLPGAPFIENAGFNSGVLRWRGSAGLSWSTGPFSVQWSTQYYGSYFVYFPGRSQAENAAATLNQGSARIGSQFYHDLLFTYRFAAGRPAGTPGVDLSFGIQNLFDTEPRALAGAFEFGGYSNYGDPRLRRFTVGAHLSF